MEDPRLGATSAYARDLIRHKASKMIGKCGLTYDDCEDLEQELYLDLLLRLAKFDPDKASLNTFMARVVDHQVSKILRHRLQAMRP